MKHSNEPAISNIINIVRRNFTLIELLVVIAIIAMMAAAVLWTFAPPSNTSPPTAAMPATHHPIGPHKRDTADIVVAAVTPTAAAQTTRVLATIM